VASRFVLYNFRGHSPPLEAMRAPGWHPPPLGDATAVRDDISRALEVDWSDLLRGVVDGGSFTIAFVLEPDGVMESLSVAVAGDGKAEPLIVHLCLVNGWAAYDVEKEAFLDLDEVLDA
jgi:hypothetical protein